MTRTEILQASFSERPVQMRLPFQFGSTEVRETAEAHCRVAIAVDGCRVEGRSAQLMVPRWFNKTPTLSNYDTIDELRRVVAAAVRLAPGQVGTALDVTRELRDRVADALPDVPKLAQGFGPALVEMAVIDALCRALDLPFWQAARADVFGLTAGCPPDMTADDMTRALSAINAPEHMILRHTVGFDAPLWRADVGSDAPDDGLPVSLEEVIAATGIAAFKIKLKGDPDADLQRLRKIAALIDRKDRYSVTLDANEQYQPAEFNSLLQGLAGDRALDRLVQEIRFVEQPFAREVALHEPVSASVPLVIDESDDTEDAFARALTLGWSGTSIKSCKGMLRALINKARAEAAGALLSGEDLTCQPGLCWMQDTAMMAACGVPDVERNGHHFAGGLQGAPDSERAALLRRHGDILAEMDGKVALRIAEGRVAVETLAQPCIGW